MATAIPPVFQVLKFGLEGQTDTKSVWPKGLTWLSKGDIYMSGQTAPKLTPRDFRILERVIDEHDGKHSEYLITSIRKKLDAAQVIFAEDLADDVVTIDSRFEFSIDSGAPQECRLVLLGYNLPSPQHMALESPRGIALLGLAVSEQTIIDYDVRNENLEVLRVLYQPEAESRARGARTGLRLVSNKVPARRQVGAPNWDGSTDDDPGPTAA